MVSGSLRSMPGVRSGFELTIDRPMMGWMRGGYATAPSRWTLQLAIFAAVVVHVAMMTVIFTIHRLLWVMCLLGKGRCMWRGCVGALVDGYDSLDRTRLA